MSSKFVSESELEEARKKRQEEWEKVRKPTDPIERPDEPYDSRSLFERLQEQKQKKETEYEEAHKLKNMIKGLDDDEIEFLDLVDRSKEAEEKKKRSEEARELNDFRNRVAVLETESDERRLLEGNIISKSKHSNQTKPSQQQKLLKNAVLTKRRRDIDPVSEESDQALPKEPPTKIRIEVPQSGMKCIGILPSFCPYEKSSDENSSDSDSEEPANILQSLAMKYKEQKNPNT